MKDEKSFATGDDTSDEKIQSCQGYSHHLTTRVKRLVENNEFLSPDFLCNHPLHLNPNKCISFLLYNCNSSKVVHSKHLEKARYLEDALKDVNEAMGNLKKGVDDALMELDQVRTGSSKVVQKAQALQLGRTHCAIRRTLAQCLVDRLKVSDRTVRVLRDNKLPSTVQEAQKILESEFFLALEDVLNVYKSAMELNHLVDSATTAPNKDSDVAAVAETAAALGKAAITEILQETSKLFSLAIESLFNICQLAIRSSDDPAVLLAPEYCEFNFTDKPYHTSATPLFRKAINMLRLRPAYFSTILLDLAQKRRILLQEKFQDSLVKGSKRIHRQFGRGPSRYNDIVEETVPSTTSDLVESQPMELYAFETPRYIGDMLAFLHEAVLAEKEFIEAIITNRIVDDDVLRHPEKMLEDNLAFQQNQQNKDDIELQQQLCGNSIKPISYLLDSTFLGIVPVFRNRTTQALSRSKTSPVELCQTQQIFEFYIPTFCQIFCNIKQAEANIKNTEQATSDIINPDHIVFIKCCKDLESDTHRLLLEAWEAQIVRLSSLPTSSLWTPDLSAPPFLRENVGCLADVLQVFECSPSLQTSMTLRGDTESRKDNFTISNNEATEAVKATINAAVTPLLNFCRQASQFLSKDSQHIYLLNCYRCVQNGLCRFPAAAEHVKICNDLIEEQTSAFAVAQTQKTLEKLGFSEKLEALRQWKQKSEEAKERQPLTSISTLHPLALSACLRSFYNSLFSTGALNLLQVDQISCRNLRSELRHIILTNIANAYEELYKGTLGSGVATHTPEQIRALLDL